MRGYGLQVHGMSGMASLIGWPDSWPTGVTLAYPDYIVPLVATYALGRYLNVEKAGDGLYLLDFNFAYAPACAYSPHYNCPIPPKANRLKVAIRAGEMDGHYMEH